MESKGTILFEWEKNLLIKTFIYYIAPEKFGTSALGFWRGYTNGVVQTISKQHASILCDYIELRAVGKPIGFLVFPGIPCPVCLFHNEVKNGNIV